ncbi:MAG: hypothetical protein HY585_03540, partial [Candidatus Omnitrophica bacterium]|nr:hypothetical protein [Candidatus Omnitrophota bacterium]
IAWKDKRVAQFHVHCPLERATTYYFSQSGDDMIGDGSEVNPLKTLAKAQALINASSGNIRLRFKRGDEWNETTGINTGKNNITIDDYGAGELPLFNNFVLKYNSSGWTHASGNRYTRPETMDIAWVRDQADRLGEVLGTVLAQQNSAANCEANSNSFYYDPVADLLHINLAGVDPNTKNLEAVKSNLVHGVRFAGNGCRVENIRADGWGIHRYKNATQVQPFSNHGTGNEANLFKGCEGYFSNTHVMAHLASGGVGGKSMWMNCTAGYGQRKDSSGTTTFNSFSTYGGQETWWIGSTAKYGHLKSYHYPYTNNQSAGVGFLDHSGLGKDHLLNVVYGCKASASIWPVSRFADLGSSGGDVGGATDPSQASAFLADSIQEKPLKPVGNSMSYVRVIYGSKLYFWPKARTPQLIIGNLGPRWLINSYLEVDLSKYNDTASTSIFNATGSTTGSMSVKFWHSFIKMINASGLKAANRFGIEYDVRTNSGPIGEGVAKTARLINSIVAYDNPDPDAMRLALTNTSDHIVNNAYFQVRQPSDGTEFTQERFQGNDMNGVVLSSMPSLDVSHPQLLQAGTIDTTSFAMPRLSHDINGKARTVAIPDIGPVDYSSP